MFWFLAAIAGVLFFYYFLLKPQLYWFFKNVKQRMPVPLFGDYCNVILKHECVSEMVDKVYKQFKNERYCGVYQTTLRTLMIRDPELIKQLTVKDFDYFLNHRDITPPSMDPLWGFNLLALHDESWKEMRATLSPTFTASKMRGMFLLMENSARQFVDFYQNMNQKQMEIELKDSFSRFANDVIANCAFGLNVDSLKEPQNDFYQHGKSVTNLSNFWLNVKYFLNTISPKITETLNLGLFPKTNLDFFESIILRTIKMREEQNIVRPDVINLLMQARKGKLAADEAKETTDSGFATAQESHVGKNEKIRKTEFTDKEVAAQVFVFFFAGFETISTTMAFLIYELAVDPDIQEKLRREIDDTYRDNNGQLTYDVLNQMKYLDMTVSETLRKNTIFPAIDRVCTKPYTIQPQNPGESALDIQIGDNIWIPIQGLHNDEEYYPNPGKFDPERFSDENKANINPYTYVPFGSGPRNCIGSRFALMEVKVLTFHILRNFEFTVIKKTAIPIKLIKGSFNLGVEGGIWVGLTQREMP